MDTSPVLTLCSHGGNVIGMTNRERDCYRILHTNGELALIAAVGDEVAARLINSWQDTGVLRIKQLDPGRAPKPVRLMTPEEDEAWSAHVLANSGYVIKTFAKHAA